MQTPTAMPLNSAEAWLDETVLDAVLLTARVSVVATIVCLPFGVLIGTWLARTPRRWRAAVDALVTCPLVIPPVVTGLVILQGLVWLEREFGVGIAYTWWAAAMASAALALPLLVRTVRTAVESIDPRLPQVAATLGASRWRVFRTVTLPLSWKGIVGGAVLAWARAAGEFGATIVVAGNMPGRTQTIPLAIYSALQSPKERPIWPLVIVAVAMSVAAVAASEILVRRGRSEARRAKRSDS